MNKKRALEIPRHWSVESPPQAHTFKTGLTFSAVLGRFLCSPHALFFLQVVKNKSDKKTERRDILIWQELFSASDYKASAARHQCIRFSIGDIDGSDMEKF